MYLFVICHHKGKSRPNCCLFVFHNKKSNTSWCLEIGWFQFLFFIYFSFSPSFGGLGLWVLFLILLFAQKVFSINILFLKRREKLDEIACFRKLGERQDVVLSWNVYVWWVSLWRTSSLPVSDSLCPLHSWNAHHVVFHSILFDDVYVNVNIYKSQNMYVSMYIICMYVNLYICKFM